MHASHQTLQDHYASARLHLASGGDRGRIALLAIQRSVHWSHDVDPNPLVKAFPIGTRFLARPDLQRYCTAMLRRLDASTFGRVISRIPSFIDA